ncbi:MAG: aminomethyl-transferring glycine dehydrogenase subunit GcvPA [Caldilineaceae bacterium]|nr:aminomethyl-transferring glycine dehydrogenase subunit GcvPA [Caldilineaceae bacterium]MBP8106721.1 aminomethyl-transferring glycine dehydrogenase subunit GcvPA [Caldilineaceae bacterium]MBP8124156.1 aminomethyl-transferring glycine dehydrogenase subunit GcvPA [Caldilineaceae bacterium]MBP9074753.1 aminomethyl-transferring glycine dehydrogenase subunit GcvPA [Caldilineaceae bacterium]
MAFIVNTDQDRAKMLGVLGLEKMEDLFHDVPEAHRFPDLDLPPRLSEVEVLGRLQQLAERNEDLDHNACFLGAGAYFHYVPSTVDYVLSRGEFYTAYTPYQPEVAQGTLQAIYEYQTMIANLSGMEVSNASHYDGATSAAEAVVMALNLGRYKRSRVIMAPTVHPEYRKVVRTYTQGFPLDFVGHDLPGFDYLDALTALIDKNTACVIVQNPDFLGTIQTPTRLQQLADAVHAQGAYLIVAANPISLGILTPPGEYGADIFVGEGQATGNSLNFGGPYLGLFACKMEHVRKSAGRIIGQTIDLDENPGYVLTLVAREQFIRREKATSNICTNQSLNALACAAYLAALGKNGLPQVARMCYDNTHYLATEIGGLAGYQVLNTGSFFHEFAVKCPAPVAEINRYLIESAGIVGGYDLGQHFPELGEHVMLLCATEMVDRQSMDDLVAVLASFGEGETRS